MYSCQNTTESGEKATDRSGQSFTKAMGRNNFAVSKNIKI